MSGLQWPHTISIHALRKESDRQQPERVAFRDISIHALRKESDSAENSYALYVVDFNPRSP